jgi:hypothetical protein
MGHDDDKSKDSSAIGHSKSHITHRTDKYHDHAHGGHVHHE